MPSQWVKEELKKDFLVRLTEKTIEYFKSNREKAITYAVVAFIVIIIVYITIIRFHKASELAYEQVGFTSIYLKSGDFDQTINLADQVIKTHPGGVQGGYANFYKGEALYHKGNFEEAAKSYAVALPLLKKVQDMGAMIFFNIGKSYEAAAKYNEAITYYKKLADEYSAHYLIAESQMGQARCYESLGDIKTAIAIYQNVASLNSTTMYKNIAEAKLRGLQPQIPMINMLQPVKKIEISPAKKPAAVTATPSQPASK